MKRIRHHVPVSKVLIVDGLYAIAAPLHEDVRVAQADAWEDIWAERDRLRGLLNDALREHVTRQVEELDRCWG